ncbi:MAG: hypothetical protein ACRC9U_03500, partial [Metamycoplasmataceae bacterium]
ITDFNFDKFTSAWDSKTRKITLTPIEGYQFVTPTTGGLTLVSNEIIIQLNIKANTTAQEILITDLNASPKISQATLALVFEGITPINYEYISASWDLGTRKITLAAKTGYEFTTASVISLPIIVKMNTTLNTTNQIKVTELELATEPTDAIINSLFDNVPDNTIIQSKEWDTLNRKIKLTLKNGYLFENNTNTLVSSPVTVQLDIIANPTPLEILITDLNPDTNGLISQQTLEKVFGGTINKNHNLITSTFWSLSKRTITLTLKDGYIFANQTDTSKQNILTSNKIIVKMNTTLNTTNLVKVLESELVNTPSDTIINSLFDNAPDNSIIQSKEWDTVNRKIKLTLKDGYVFANPTDPNLSNVLTSAPVIIQLDITALPTPPEISIIELNDSPKISQATLAKVFGGSINENYALITSTLWSLSNRTITLSLQDGYEFKNPTTPGTTLVSNEITVKMNTTLNTTNSVKVPESELATNPTYTRIKDLFDNVPNNAIIQSKEWNIVNRTIILTLKDGYLFKNNTNTLTSSPVIIQLNITVNTTPPEILISELNPTSPDLISQATLAKVFGGSINENYALITSTLWSLSNRTITLTLKDGYEFANQTAPGATLISSKITVKMNITSQTGIKVSESELAADPSDQILNNVFNNIPDMAIIKSRVWDKANRTIILTLNEGYIFENPTPSGPTNELISESIIIQLNIIANPTPLEILISELNPITGTITKETLKKAFEGSVEANYSNIASIQWISTTGIKGKIKLTLNLGYEFQSKASEFDILESVEITPTIIPLTLTKNLSPQVSKTEFDKDTISEATLNNVFGGINIGDLGTKFNATWTKDSSTTGTITLTAIGDHRFDDGSSGFTDTFISNPITTFTLLDIKQNPAFVPGTTLIYQSEIDAKPIKEILGKIFAGADLKDSAKFTANLTQGSVPTKATITLIAADGYKFGDEANPTIDLSVEITITPNTYLNIQINNSTPTIEIPEAELNGNPISLDTLRKAFTISDDKYFNHFTSFWDSSAKKITLTAKPGYQFNALGSSAAEYTLLSEVITPTPDPTLPPFKSNIQAKVVSAKITEAEVMANPISKETLEKAFDGITDQNFDQFKASWDSVNKKIVLSLKK